MLIEYNVLQGENIFDLVLKFYNDLDQTYTFIQNNPQLENINYDLGNTSNVVVKYDPNYILNTPSEIPTETATEEPSTNTIKAYEVQTLFDICAMTYGSFDNMYKLIQDNGIDSINEDQIAQKYFTYTTSNVVDNILSAYLASNNILFATGFNITSQAVAYYILTEDSFIMETESGDQIILE